MKRNITTKLAIMGTALLPAIVFAVTTAGSKLTEVVADINTIVKALIPIVFALGILAFFWGLVLYIFSQGNEEKKKDGKGIMLWALVALFIMASVWGIIGLAQRTLDIRPGDQPTTPTFKLPTVN